MTYHILLFVNNDCHLTDYHLLKKCKQTIYKIISNIVNKIIGGNSDNDITDWPI